MTKRMLIDDTQPEETRVVIVDGNKVEDVEFESSSRKQIKGNIYSAKVIRIEPSLQAAFIDYGGNKHGFLAFNEIHPDYYNVSDEVRQAVEAEVDEIIAGKIRYLKEREAERARYKAEKEAQETRRRMEAQQAHEIEESQMEPAQNVQPENDTYLTSTVSAEMMEVSSQTEENGESATFVDETQPKQRNARRTYRKRRGSTEENATVTENSEELAASSKTFSEQIVESPAADTIESSETVNDTISETDEEAKPRKHRKATCRPRDRKKNIQTQAEAAGLSNEMIEDEIDEDLDSDDDDIETEESGEYNFDTQRKLLIARKLFHRSTIQDVIKEGQTLLVQIVKEERGNKGAACTTYISLAGRYCVLMPNRIKSGGVSRKITNVSDRRRLKSVIKNLPLNADMSLIIRTAGEDKSDADIIRDYNYLIRTWNAIRYGALRTPAPAIIYEEGNLIKRALRDMYTKDIDEVIIDGNEAYQTARNFVKILSPHNLKHIHNRKAGDVPVFQRFQIEAQLDKLHNPVVQLESGGYLVINPTEALVSIDVNSGRATKEKDIEETALKTNLEAADEIAKQLKMRDLAGLIVVDFIDMYEQQNNVLVERRMKEAMKDDRARIQIAKMSIFGLLEISRQRMHSSFIESNYQPCPYCHGRGVTRTVESGATLILRSIEGEGVRNRSVKLTVSVPVELATYLLNHKRKQLSVLEETYDLQIIIAGDLNMKDASDFKICREKLQVANTVSQDATTTCYEAENMEYDEDENIPDEKEEEENGDHRFRFRRNGRGRRQRRSYEHRNDGRATDNIADKQAETKPEKKSWWQKLLG
ncbi:MAG: Rne/Rng family ribonuclease [Alphaproteobacteria bacterium]|nr:Rne/Rng family ribonuclease [Alphaproteobacteria bacterium]